MLTSSESLNTLLRIARYGSLSACLGLSATLRAQVTVSTNPAVPLSVAPLVTVTSNPLPAPPTTASPAPVLAPTLAPTASQTGLPAGQASILSLPELQALIAPIALYPDALLAQMLMAATYPLEVASATIWLQNNPLSASAFEAALAQQRWDNSVKALAHFPEALKLMGNQLEWTHRLGDAYLVQPAELMQAVQALRAQARQAGHLQSGPQMLVSTDPLANIIIEPANPQVVYVPTYNPMVVYGAWPYVAYPPYAVYNPGWGALAFGAGVGAGVALWATPYWGYGSIYINNGYYNRFNQLYNAPGYRYPVRAGGTSYWAYNGAHRYNLPYRYPNHGVTPAAQHQLNQVRQQAQQAWPGHPAGANTVRPTTPHSVHAGARPATTSAGQAGRASRHH